MSEFHLALARLLYWHTVKEAADLIGVSPETLQRWKEGTANPAPMTAEYAKRRVRELAEKCPELTWEVLLQRLLQRYSGRMVASCLGVLDNQVSRWRHGYCIPGKQYRRRLLELWKEMGDGAN